MAARDGGTAAAASRHRHRRPPGVSPLRPVDAGWPAAIRIRPSTTSSPRASSRFRICTSTACRPIAQRYTAYRYRIYDFAPSEIVPGFANHQTSRADDTGEMPERTTPDRGRVLLPAARARLGLSGLALFAPVLDRHRRLEQRAQHDSGARSGGVPSLLRGGSALVPRLDRLDRREQGAAAAHAPDPRPAGHRQDRRHVRDRRQPGFHLPVQSQRAPPGRRHSTRRVDRPGTSARPRGVRPEGAVSG